jgi:colanic acid/amylovoran biosynthesis protein
MTPQTKSDRSSVRLSLFGASGNSANLGVQALMASVVGGLEKRLPGMDLTVFDESFGISTATLPSSMADIRYRRCGARLSRRYYRPESFWNMAVSARFGGLGNRGANLVLRSDVILDITGGDSFSDIYGPRRFAAAVAPKRLALRTRRPLILLPQAYGPFTSSYARSVAQELTKSADEVWARDEVSYATVRDLVGESFDPARHRLGVDVAFGLEAIEPGCELGDTVRLFGARHHGMPFVGMNVNGLLYNDGDAAARFGLGYDYRQVCSRLLQYLLDDDRACVLLINHVLSGFGPEADRDALSHLVQSVPERQRTRLLVVSDPPGPSVAKWCIAQCDWFVGARMHATIAALSSGVPAAAIPYSHKAVGVFGTCGMESSVCPLGSDTNTVLATVVNSFRHRANQRARLSRFLPSVLKIASEQLDKIAITAQRLMIT